MKLRNGYIDNNGVWEKAGFFEFVKWIRKKGMPYNRTREHKDGHFLNLKVVAVGNQPLYEILILHSKNRIGIKADKTFKDAKKAYHYTTQVFKRYGFYGKDRE